MLNEKLFSFEIYINNIFLRSKYIVHTIKCNHKNVILPSPSTIKHVDNIVHFFKFGNALITTVTNYRYNQYQQCF